MTNSPVEHSSPPPSILVVEDEDATRIGFRRILEELGYVVREATNGREALRALEHRDFEVIVLDLAMPEMDGIEFIEAAYRKMPGIRVVVVSGFMQGPMLKIAEHLGADVGLRKPVGPQRLLDTVYEMLQAHYAGIPSAASRRAARARQRGSGECSA